MSRKACLVLLFCLATALLCLGASVALADPGWPGVGTPQVAHVNPDGSWWAGGGGWGDPSYAEYDPGTPIPAGDSVSMYIEAIDPDRTNLEQAPQTLLLSVTVKGADGAILLATTEAQSAQFWYPIKWWPGEAGWWRGWEAHVGRLPAGVYQVTFVVHLTTTLHTFYSADGVWVPVTVKPFRDVNKFSITVQ